MTILTIDVLTTAGFNFETEDLIDDMGSALLFGSTVPPNPVNTATQFNLVDVPSDRKFVVDGAGFTYNNGVVASGNFTAIHVFVNTTLAPLLNLTLDAPEPAQAFFAATRQQAAGDDTAFENITGDWEFDFTGNSGVDVFDSGDQADTLRGGGGNDNLSGGGGDDVLVGQSGTDTLVGGDGFDSLRGGSGNDTLNGANESGVESGPSQSWRGGRADYSVTGVTGTINVVFGATQTVTGDGSVGTDTLVSVQQVRGTNGIDTFAVLANFSTQLFPGFAEFEGLGGNDTITGNTSVGFATRVSYQTATAGVTVDLVAGSGRSTVADTAGVGIDSFTGVSQVRGSAFADTLTAAGGRDLFTFFGQGGNDTIIGTMEGINNFDFNTARYDNATAGITVVMGTGTVAQGVTSSVVGDASVGSDTLINIEAVRGSDFNDTFTANAGFLGQFGSLNDFEGDGGNDTINGNGATRVTYLNAWAGVTVNLQTGTAQSTGPNDAAHVGVDTFTGVNQVRASDYGDIIVGSNGAQAERFSGRDGNDNIDGGGGVLDSADYRNAPAAVNVNLVNGTASDGEGGTDTLVRIEGARGSEFNDTLVGDANDNILGGQNGDDNISGGAGSDTIVGDDDIDLYSGVFGASALFDSGNDTLNGDDGNDTVYGGLGNDTLNGGTGVDALFAGDGNDTVNGGTDGDALHGQGGDDIIHGNDGDDVLVGLNGGDQLFGDAGNDTLIGDEGGDALDGGIGGDQLFGYGSDDTLNGGLGGDFLSGGAGEDTMNGGDDDDNLQGEDGNDTLNGDGGNDVLIGHAGTDTINGGIGSDTLIGLDGNDTLDGGDGVDLLYGYADNDTLTGGLAGDGLFGGLGGDNLFGGDGDDGMHGEEGDDNVQGDAGNDVLVGLTGNDNLTSGTGNDTLIGDGGNDTLNGGDDNDQMFGYADVDTLNGGNGDDFGAGGDGDDNLNGDAGGDVLDGEAGNDTLNGGDGGDNLNGNDGNDTENGEAGNDGMLGWNGNDVLNGGTGNDYMYGDRNDGLGGGNDRFVFQDGCGNDLIIDFEGGAGLGVGVGDIVDLRGMGFDNFAEVMTASTDVVGGVFVALDLGNPLGTPGDALFIQGVTKAALAADDFLVV